MKRIKSKQGEIILFISLLCFLILIMFSALNYLESKQLDEEESIVITSNQVQSFLWILGNYSNQQQQLITSSPLIVNDTFGYNVTNSENNSTISLHSSEVNYSEIDPNVNTSKLISSHQNKNCSLPIENRHFLDYLCNNQHIVLFSIRASDRNLIKINGAIYYSIQLIKVFRSTGNLKKALKKGIIIFMNGNNQTNSVNQQFKRGHVYLVTVTLDNNLPLITNCDLQLDWSLLPYEVKNSLMKFFNEPTSSCILHNYKIKSKLNSVD